jgi:hypothetical protein
VHWIDAFLQEEKAYRQPTDRYRLDAPQPNPLFKFARWLSPAQRTEHVRAARDLARRLPNTPHLALALTLAVQTQSAPGMASVILQKMYPVFKRILDGCPGGSNTLAWLVRRHGVVRRGYEACQVFQSYSKRPPMVYRSIDLFDTSESHPWTHRERHLLQAAFMCHAEGFAKHLADVWHDPVSAMAVVQQPCGLEEVFDLERTLYLLRLARRKVVYGSGADAECSFLLEQASKFLGKEPWWQNYVLHRELAFCLGAGEHPDLILLRLISEDHRIIAAPGSAAAAAGPGWTPHDALLSKGAALARLRCVVLVCGDGLLATVTKTVHDFGQSLSEEQESALRKHSYEAEHLQLRLAAFHPSYRNAIERLVVRRAWLESRRPRQYEVQQRVADGKLDALFAFEELVGQLEAFALKTKGHNEDLLDECLWQAFVDEGIRSGRLQLTWWQWMERHRHRLACVP